MTNLKDKTVLITGASAGIGEAIAREFAEQGCRLILIARRFKRLEKLATELKTETHLIELDIRNREAVEKAISSLPESYQSIDILVNNAGLSRDLGKIFEANPDGWEDMIDTNIKGLLYVSRMVLLGMVERNSGHIINIGSIAGHEVYPKGHVYCATKHAVDAITKGMRMDLFDKNIRVSTIDPGLVETEFSEVRFYGDKERAKKVYQGYKALEARDIAESVVWVASRPSHVQIAELIILPSDQASAAVLNRREVK